MGKILICNNNAKILENIKNIFKDKKQCALDIAKSYEVMLDLVKKQNNKEEPYAVVITDVNLEDKIKPEILNKLSSSLPNSTIVATYSYSDDAVQWLNEETRTNANVLFLKKPFEDIELLQIVENNLNKPVSSFMVEQNGAVCDFSSPAKNLLDNISHEIRTPLASIVGITEVLQKTRLNEEQKRHVNAILKCSDTLLNVMTDMIDFERVRDQNIALECNDFNFVDLLEGTVTLVARQALEKDVDVNLAIGNNLPSFIHSDEAKLRKILWALITNAVKYTNYGNVNIYCDFETKGKQNNLVLTVKDTGIGIDEKALENLFKAPENSTTPYRSGGSGIGLSMAKKMLDAFKGDIKATSVVDQGSEFVVVIPVENSYDKMLQIQSGNLTPLNEKSGIFVSTNKLTADAIIKQFSKQNCYLDYADSIRKSRSLIQQENKKLHWCIIDDSLVQQENIPLIKNLILTCQQQNIKVLLVSKNQSAINAMHSLGVSRVLMKPCLEKDIRQVLTYHSDTAKDSSFAPSLLPMDKFKAAKSLRILVAEDNDVNQMVLSNIIKRLGHSVDIAKHGKIAVDKSAMQQYDLALIDLQMPILDGIEAAKKIRVNNKHLTLVAMSSNVSAETKQKCTLAGFSDIITKPVSEQTLLEVISKLD